MQPVGCNEAPGALRAQTRPGARAAAGASGEDGKGQMGRRGWGAADPAMDPKWNPAALMGLGAALTIFSYVTSDRYPVMAVVMGMGVGGLVLASGVVLAFIQTFRD